MQGDCELMFTSVALTILAVFRDNLTINTGLRLIPQMNRHTGLVI